MPRRLVVLLLIGLSVSCTSTAVAVPPKVAPGPAAKPAPKTAVKGAQATPLAESLLDRAPFSIPTQELLSLTSPSAPQGLDVEVLLDDQQFAFDADGKVAISYHYVYRVLTEAGAENWGSVGAHYRPWIEDKPEIRARVTSARGASFDLNPATLVDALASQNDGNMFSDDHHISAPLPAVHVGSVVETFVRTQQHKPLFEAGTLHRYFFYSTTYAALSRVRVDAPAKLNVAVKGQKGTPKPVVVKKADRVVTQFVARDLLPLSEDPGSLDPDVAYYPEVNISTGRAWGDIARAYSRIVDEQIKGFDAASIVKTVTAPGDSAAGKVAKLLAHLHREVRYTGLELGDRSIVPVAPSETLARKYGDCKDKSTLLVALLRAAGVDAHVALLRAGSERDVAPDAVGFGLFDHAIVHVGGASPYWIDPTDPYSPAGDLPYGDQDRLALIAGEKTSKLARTPRVAGNESAYIDDVFIDFAEHGKASVREVTTGTSSMLSGIRGAFDQTDDQLRERFRGYMTRRYGAEITTASAQHALDLTQPFALDMRGVKSEQYRTVDEGGIASIAPNALYEYLDGALYETADSEISEKERAQEASARDARYREPDPIPVYVPKAHQRVVRYHLALPEGFAWRGLPDALERSVAGLRASRTVESPDERHAVVTYTLEASPRVVALKDLDAVRTALTEFDEQAGASVRFVYVPHEAMEQHAIKKAMQQHRELLKKYPQSVHARVRYAHDLTHMGLALEGRAVVDQLVREHPKDARAQWAHALVYLYDEMGRDSYPGYDIARAEKSMRLALQLDPEEPLYYQGLIAILQQKIVTSPPLNQPASNELVGLYEKLASKFDDHSRDLDLMRTRMWKRDYAGAEKLASKVEKSDARDLLWVACVAALQGADAAKRKAEQLVTGDTKTTLISAFVALSIMSDYAHARPIGVLPVIATEMAPLVKALDGIGRQAECTKALHPAARATLEAFMPYLGREDALLAWSGDLKKKKDESFDRGSLMGALEAVFQGYNPMGRSAEPLHGYFLKQLLPCAVRPEVTEEEGAVKVALHRASAPNSEASPTFYLRKAGKGYALIGRKLENRAAMFSRGMLLAIAENKLPEARVWARWASKHLEKVGGKADEYSYADVARAFTPKALDTATAKELSLLAAGYSVWADVDGRDEVILDAAPRTGSAEYVRGLSYARALARLDDQPATSADLLQPLHAATPEDSGLWKLYIRALFLAKRHAQVLSELDAFDKRYPEDDFGAGFRNGIDVREGKYAKAVERTRARMQENKAEKRGEINNAAWDGLFVKGDLKDALSLAQAACDPEEEAPPSSLHTLATVQAEMGDIDEAHKHIMAAMAKMTQREPWEAAWYPLARIAEQLDMPRTAAAMYERIHAPSEPSETSTYNLARSRLASRKKK